MMKLSPMLAVDFYKTGHPFQYPEDTEVVYSNFTPRSSRIAKDSGKVLVGYEGIDDFDEQIIWHGAEAFCQWFLIDFWNEGFFNKPKNEVVGKYKKFMDRCLGPNAVPIEKLEELHDIGYLPLEIKSLPEGSRVPIRVATVTIKNTHPSAYWVTNFIESVFSSEVWKPTTIATIASEYRRLLDHFAELTGSPADFVQWQGHDFSFRGESGWFDAASGNSGHLIPFTGTDTVPAIEFLCEYHGADLDTELVGGSVAATEHAVTCASIGDYAIQLQEEGFDGDILLEAEYLFLKRLITEIYPEGIVSAVADTNDLWKVITQIYPRLKNEIMSRKPNALGQAKLVCRPDSGDPVKIILGDPDAPEGSPANLGVVRLLWNIFGGTETKTGHKLLDSHIGVIYGDSITLDRAYRILNGLHEMGFASANIVFGIGSYTYQLNTRDTFGIAIKATAITKNGRLIEISKKPITDSGTKESAKGLIKIVKENGRYVQYDQVTPEEEKQGDLRTIFLNSKMHNRSTLKDMRYRYFNKL